MIRCSSCGTLNQDSRKSCTNCGTTLPQTQIRCPNCGTLNPLGNVLCDKCNSRLIEAEDVIPSDLFDEQESEETRRRESAASQVKGISLPTRSPGQDDAADQELPDWLRNLSPGAEAYDDDQDFGLPAPQEAEESAEAYPDWLSDLLEESGSGGEGLGFDAGPAEVEEEADALALDASALPDWFASAAELDSEAEGPGEPAFEEPATDLPDWLAELSGGEDFGTPAGASGETPDWLLADAAEDAAGESTEATEIPDWLLETAADEQAPAAGPEPVLFAESELPDWLSDARQLSEVAPEAPGTPSETEERYPEVVEAPETFEDETAEADALAALLDFESGEEEEAAPELPEWLRAPEAGAETEVELEPELDETLPAWLTTLAEDETSLRADEVVLPPPEPAEEAEEVAGVDIAAPEPLEEAALPDWLAEIDVDEEAAPSSAATFAEAPAPEPEPAPAEQPDWLREIAPPEVGDEATESTPAFLIDDLDADEESALGEPGAESAEIPAWLRDLEPATGRPPAHLPLPEADDLARAELPGWLQELAPAEIALHTMGTDAAGVTDELVSADIPDWVRALQPQPGQERTTATAAAPPTTPAEPEGPLEGLPGVLQPLAMVDAPSDAHPTPESSLPEAVTAQAQLWQQLLEQPRMVARPVFQERRQARQGATWVRLLVAAVLVLGLFAAFWLRPEGLSLIAGISAGTQNVAVTAPGAQGMVATLAGLQPGDGVIVAVEYGNAYAEEMTEIATPVLDHLAAQQAAIETVSTLPEGVVLGISLAAAPQETRYLAGNASGIAGFLAQPDNEGRRHLVVLASSPERVRWWLEQVALVNQTRENPLTVSLGLSASAGPRVTPYLETSLVQGWLVGLPDALVYRALRGATAAGDPSLDGYGHVQEILVLAHWSAGALLVVGGVVSLVRRSPQGTDRKGGR